MRAERSNGGRARVVLVVLAALAIGGVAGWIARAGRDAGAGSASSSAGEKTLWTCGMHPEVIRDAPGDCPICHMKLTPLASSASASTKLAPGERRVRYWIDAASEPPYVASAPGKSPAGRELVPVHSEELAAGDAITIDPRVAQNMGLRTAEVVRGALVRELRLPAIAMEPEPNHLDVNLRVSGWIEKLWADTDGLHVVKGAPLFELYSPELVAATEELIAARRTATAKDASDLAKELLALAKRRLVALGVDEAEVTRLAALEHSPRTIAIASPIDGHVTMKDVVAGARVEAGQRVLRLADNSTMWIDIALTASSVSLVQLGQPVAIDVDAVPGRTWSGNVSFVHPHFDMETRSAKARVSVQNADWTLREGMTATARVALTIAPDALLVPRDAVIDTGARQIAFVVLADGSFEPTRVRLGASGDGGLVQVLEGLGPGERVVTSGQFLLDAESRVRESVKRFLAAEASGPSRLEEPEASPDAVDAVLGPYLELARVLGADAPPSAPFNALGITVAAQKLVEASRGPTRTRAEELRARAFELVPAQVERQRELFKPLSEAMVAIVERAPPTAKLGERFYVLHCPMAVASWISTTEQVHNPFYADSMKQCGEVVRAVEPARRR